MLGLGLYSTTILRRRGGFSAPPPSVGVEYGRSLNIFFGTADIALTDTVNGHINWNPKANSGSWVDSNGDPVTTTLTAPGSSWNQDYGTWAVDDGSKEYELMKRIRTSNTGADISAFTMTDVPFAKYDVFLYWQGSNFNNTSYSWSEGYAVGVSINDQQLYVTRNAQGYQGVFKEVSRGAVEVATSAYGDDNILVFRDLTDVNFTVKTQNAGDIGTFIGFAGIQIRERLDSEVTKTGTYSRRLLGFGDSYMDGTGSHRNNPARILRTVIADNEWMIPLSVTEYAVGGSTFEDQTQVIEATDLSNSVLVWWDGHSNGRDTVENYMARVERMRVAKGDERWFIILPNGVPGEAGTTGDTFNFAFRDAMIAAGYGDHILDPVPIYQAMDPDRSVNGILPASVFADTHHLTAAAEVAVCEVAGPLIVPLFA